MQPGRFKAEMKDNATVDLTEYVALSELGNRWVRRIREIDQVDEPGDSDL